MSNLLTRGPEISEFSAALKENSISRQSRYYVEFTLPKIFQYSGKATGDIQLVNLYVEQTQFPEFALATQTVTATSIHTEMPYDKMFGNVAMTFMCDRDMVIKSFFDSWSQGILNTMGGVFNYYEDYVIPELNIYQLDDNHDVVYVVTLYNAYPKIVNDMLLASGSHDYNRFQVVFAYEQWNSFQCTPFREQYDAAGLNDGYSIYDTLGSTRSYGPSGESSFKSNFDIFPGIDSLLGVTGISGGLDLLNKMKNPQLMKDSLRRTVSSLSFESMKPLKQKILESLPRSMKQVGGSVLGRVGGGFGF